MLRTLMEIIICAFVEHRALVPVPLVFRFLRLNKLKLNSVTARQQNTNIFTPAYFS